MYNTNCRLNFVQEDDVGLTNMRAISGSFLCGVWPIFLGNLKPHERLNLRFARGHTEATEAVTISNRRL